MTLSVVFHMAASGWDSDPHKAFYRRALRSAFNTLDLPDKKFRVAVVLANDRMVQGLNRDFRAKDKPTNVLSFPQLDDFSTLRALPEPIELGDIILARETILAEAKAQRKTVRDHTAHLMVHGLLHLFGFDHMHDTDANEMEALEITALAHVGIDNPY